MGRQDVAVQVSPAGRRLCSHGSSRNQPGVLQRRPHPRGQGAGVRYGGEAPFELEFDSDEVDDDWGEEGTGLETNDILALGVVGLIVWLLLRQKPEPPEEQVTSTIEYESF